MKHWPWWGKLIGLLLAFTLLAGSIIWWAHVRARRAWEAHQTEMATLGESLDWQDFASPEIPDDQNLAMAPLMQDIERLKALSPEHSLPGWIRPRNYFGWPAGQTFPFERVYDPNATGTPLSRELALAALTEFYHGHEQAFQEVAGCLLTSGYSRPKESPEPEIAEKHRLAKVLSERALYEIAIKDPEEALRYWQAAIQLTYTNYAPYPCAVDHLLALSITQLAMQSIHEGLKHKVWSEAHLIKIDEVLRSIDLVARLRQAFRGERAFTLFYTHRSRRDVSDLDSVVTHPSMRMALQYFPEAVLPWNRITFSKNFQQAIDILETPDGQKLHSQWNQFEDKLLETRKLATNGLRHQDSLVWMSASPMFFKTVKTTIYLQTSFDLARIAVAAERFRLAEGQYPRALEDLSPTYLDAIPSDRITGQPLIYSRQKNGRPQIYSLGWNAVDDGAKVYRDHQHGDWVWQYPANHVDLKDYRAGP